MTEQRSANTKALMWTILMIALIQMPHLAIMPGVDLIATEVFPERALQTIQTAMSLPSILSVAGGVITAMLIRWGLATKKSMVLTGLALVTLTALTAFLLHTRFWHLCLMNIMMGVGMGAVIPNTHGIMFESFDEQRRQFMSGAQSSFINAGGIVLSLAGGLLTTLAWYGGHLLLFVTIPIFFVALRVIPSGTRLRSHGSGGVQRTKLPGSVYFNVALVFVFMIMYNVGAVNISTHLAAGALGGSAAAGAATALMMAGGVASGFIFPKLSPVWRDHIFPASFLLLTIGYTLLNLFPGSYAASLAAMFICGASLSLFIPRCVFNVSNLADPTNSATATMLLSSVAPGAGGFLSPLVMTNITLAIGGESTRFRYQFTAFVCLALAAGLFIHNIRKNKKASAQEENAGIAP